MGDNPFSTASSLIEALEKAEASTFPPANESKSYVDKFNKLNHYFSDFPVEMGAMKAEIDKWKNDLINQLQEVEAIEDQTERIKRVKELLSEDKIIFLNKHGIDHIKKVQDKAFEIIKCFTWGTPSSYELFFLLCSISVHDVGNLFGRANHEKRISGMLEEACKNIIDDTVERRIISRIAGVHGGRINGNKDTIANLKNADMINNFEVREQVLASILRFADELADDCSRANYPALQSGILGEASEIFHVYSSKLHTVKLMTNPVTNAREIRLRYEMNTETAKKQFGKGTSNVYLLDEIYERTIKMERERRYCMRFLRPYCSIDSINVEIRIVNDENAFDQETITYELEEKGYPDNPYNSLKDIDDELMTGAEMADKLTKVK